MRIQFFSDTNFQLFVADAQDMGFDLEIDEGTREVSCDEGQELIELAIDYSAEVLQYG